MKISIACDHGALELKNDIKAHLEKLGHEVKVAISKVDADPLSIV